MKKLILSAAVILCALVSCDNADDKPATNRRTVAKLEVTSIEFGQIKRGDVVIRTIDTLYNVGDAVKLDDISFRVLRMESKPQQQEAGTLYAYHRNTSLK
jgi:hypothetical protein